MWIGAVAFGVVGLGVLLVALRWRVPVATARIETALRDGGFVMPGSQLDDYLHGSALRRWIGGQVARLNAWVEQVTPEAVLDEARLTTERLGYRVKRAAGAYLFIRTALMATAIVAVIWALVAYPVPLPQRLVASGILLLPTLALPAFLLKAKIRARQEEIRYSLPDVIDLLAVSAEAGMGLDGAIAAVIRRKPGALSEEFERMLLEMRLGSARAVAWERLVRRVNLQDLRAFVAALQDAEDMGVSIAGTLRAQSDALRLRRSLAVRQLAATLPLKMLFPLIFCILPALFAVLLGPGLIAIFAAFATLPQ